MTRSYRLRRREEATLGKFYDAMQKVSPPEAEEAVHPEPKKPTQPELDEALLTPESPIGDNVAGVFEQEHDGEFDTAVLSTSPGVRGLDEPEAEIGIDHEVEPALRVVDSPGETSSPRTERQSAFPPPSRRLRTDLRE